MDSLLKTLSCLMLLAVITIQLLLVSPYRERLTDDTINGRVLKIYESVIKRGTVVLDAMGNYEPNTAYIIINGDKKKMVDKFPAELNLSDGDIVEIQLKQGIHLFMCFYFLEKALLRLILKEAQFLLIRELTECLVC